ncbi:MAG: thioredoxin domain-containing protein [Thiotrichales bacterium]
MPNRLARETSPYLQQHADNPVDWYPWGEEALTRARAEQKIILLSVGYSACHWCHVMAHESFADPETADLMNALFINIKVDREERPDLDKIYQLAHQMLARRAGGWPLTMFLSPERQVPFFGGTYFPQTARHGLPAFKDLLQRLAEYYHAHHDEIESQNVAVAHALGEVYAAQAPQPLDTSVFDMARSELARDYDPERGGFGRAPKFPHPTYLTRLLRHWAGTRASGRADTAALTMTTDTLEKMAQGGLYDQIGGGFCRYSTDDDWMIPHFEKMLYDNGPLLGLYSTAYAATGNDLFHRIGRETAHWVMHEMQSPEGGYYSSLDADSESEEGRFYVWNRNEVRDLLPGDAYALARRGFGFDRAPNFEGRWHPRIAVTPARLADEFGVDVATVAARLEDARTRLYTARVARVWPARDDKILGAWNALMIHGMALAARHLALPECLHSAERALDFLRAQLWRDGRLLATYKDGHAHLMAYLDDHAFLLSALLELLQCRWRSDDLEFAQQIADVLLMHFEDHIHGGFYFTADDHETLLQRPKGFADEAIPNGNAAAAQALARLGYLLGETRYLDAAERCIRAASGWLRQSPAAHCGLLDALAEQLHPPRLVILRGDPESFATWQSALPPGYTPGLMCFAIPRAVTALPPGLAAKPPLDGTVAYLCEGLTCAAPARAPAELRAALGDRG